MNENDKIRIDLIKLFKHFGLSPVPVDEKVFTEYCNKEGIEGITFENYEDRLLDWKEDQIIKETLPHLFRILADNPEIYISEFDLEAKTKETAATINRVQAEIAHLLKRDDVPYDRHGDIMFRISRLLNAITEQSTETNRKDVETAIEDMARERFGHDLNMADIGRYHAEKRGVGQQKAE